MKPTKVRKTTHRIQKTSSIRKPTSCILAITPWLGCCAIRLRVKWYVHAQSSSMVLIGNAWNRTASRIRIRLEPKVLRMLERGLKGGLLQPWL